MWWSGFQPGISKVQLNTEVKKMKPLIEEKIKPWRGRLPEMENSSGTSPIHPNHPKSNFGKAKNSKIADRAEAHRARDRLKLTNLKISSVFVVNVMKRACG